MTFRNNRRLFVFVTLIALIGISKVQARENVARPGSGGNGLGGNGQGQLKTTGATCQPAASAIDIDINNVKARLMTGGDMWWNLGTQVAEYEVPKGSLKSSQFAASCWIGGVDVQGVLKVAAQTYRQTGNDYWPGILDGSASITTQACSDWDKFFRVYKSDINQFVELSKTGGNTNTTQFADIRSWPATGNPYILSANGNNLSLPSGSYAPFIDVDHDGVYNPDNGDYPDITGDEYIWWVFNDAGNVKQMSLTPSIGLEVQTAAFAYSSQDFLNDATFYQYRVINRSNLALDSAYFAVWDDADLGYAFDDYIGCDTNRGLGILYNGKIPDGSGQVNSYGYNIPQSALDYFQGPIKYTTVNGVTTGKILPMTNFTYYNNDFSAIGNPLNGTQIYNYMTGSIADGTRFSDDFTGAGIPTRGYGKGPLSHFVYWGDPSDNSNWSECVCGNLPGDRRMIFSAGPFELLPGAVNNIIFGAIWTPNVGGCPQTSFKAITAIDDQAQALFENGFKTIEGPQAPLLTVRELNKELVFYLTNDSLSNNYKEQYGRALQPDTPGFYNVSSVKASKILHNPDSLYKFQGYRVFQLANSTVTPTEIYGADGTIDNTKAFEVFECDLHDSVTRIINYVKNTTISDTTWIPQVKVTGKDSGIVHSFVLTQDAFAQGNDKTLINYQSYYYVAIAYAYNDFSYDKVHHSGGFNATKSDSTQDVAYLESTHASNSTAIMVVTALPNPAAGGMGTVLNSDYGSGVTITRLMGTGNGGNSLQIDEATEQKILANNIADSVTYMPGSGPVDIKVVDPVNVKSRNWQFFIKGPLYNYTGTINAVANTPEKGIQPDSGSWVLVGKDPSTQATDTIYSEEDISTVNEQLLQNYGISVSIAQTARPGDFQLAGNGYISSDITFVDPSQPWLAGVQDASDSNELNWIRSGNNQTATLSPTPDPCNFNDSRFDTGNVYGNLVNNNTLTLNTWAPFSLVAPYNVDKTKRSFCGFTAAPLGNGVQTAMYDLPSVDVVFTSDMTKWTRCAVLEMQEDSTLAQGGASKFHVRSHKSWNKEINTDGTPKYSTISGDTGMSWFPGYAINQETGERLNILFGEDSWQVTQNGNDMLWNPTAVITSPYDGSVVFGGKHYVYVLSTRYDQDAGFLSAIQKQAIVYNYAFNQIQWVGMPTLNPNSKLLSLSQGLIPTETRVRFRVTRPYGYFYPGQTDSIKYTYAPTNPTPKPITVVLPNGAGNVDVTTIVAPDGTPNTDGLPYYTFSTKDMAPTPVTNVANKDAILKRIYAVPNPYYGYSGYELNRLDTKVRIINLPAQATIIIYSLDGTLIRTLSKSDPSVSYIDWDIKNGSGLPIASGMYLMDVKAVGIGETVLRWFGAMRPTDITTY